MNYYHHYSTPPAGSTPFQYTTSPSSSTSPEDGYYAHYTTYYKAPQGTPTATRTTGKRHSRRESYTYPPGPTGWYSYPGYPTPNYYTRTPDYQSPPVNREHVSNSDSAKTKSRRYSSSGNGGNVHGSAKRRPSVRSQKQHINVDVADEAEDSPRYTYIHPRGTTGQYQHKKNASADQNFFYNQVPVYTETYDSQPTRSRARRPSQSNKTSPPKSAKPPPEPKPPPEATAKDAARAGIPAGYSLKNWDPTEQPVLLLGSVFDSNSLGKWIYDWTVYRHGPSTPITEVAGDLWLLLIKLAGKIKRADECLPRIRHVANQEIVEEFLESGERIWSRLKKLLKVCEEYMWRAAKRDSGSKGTPLRMGKNSGCEFVDSIFGRDRELEATEKAMTSIRLWNMRFDANCEEILRRPSAA